MEHARSRRELSRLLTHARSRTVHQRSSDGQGTFFSGKYQENSSTTKGREIGEADGTSPWPWIPLLPLAHELKIQRETTTAVRKHKRRLRGRNADEIPEVRTRFERRGKCEAVDR
eukprot:scaffold2436_cov249-Pinguiococcus_pyrenoidosus.AAC.4